MPTDTRTYRICHAWLEESREEFHEYEATSLSEALMMAERSEAGRPDCAKAYGICPEDYTNARNEGIAFNEADGLLME